MKILICLLISTCLSVYASAQDTNRIDMLVQKVQALEERIARLEALAVRPQQSSHAKKMMQIARQHIQQKQDSAKSEDISNAEEIYLRASTMLRKIDSKKMVDSVVFIRDMKKSFDSVVSIYPQLNRAGCAQLYRAKQESGKEKESLLKDCIERFGDCYYYDGTQVGPLAMLHLAFYYKEAGRHHEANKLFKKIRDEHAEAIGHDGELLVNKFE